MDKRGNHFARSVGRCRNPLKPLHEEHLTLPTPLHLEQICDLLLELFSIKTYSRSNQDMNAYFVLPDPQQSILSHETYPFARHFVHLE